VDGIVVGFRLRLLCYGWVADVIEGAKWKRPAQAAAKFLDSLGLRDNYHTFTSNAPSSEPEDCGGMVEQVHRGPGPGPCSASCLGGYPPGKPRHLSAGRAVRTPTPPHQEALNAAWGQRPGPYRLEAHASFLLP